MERLLGLLIVLSVVLISVVSVSASTVENVEGSLTSTACTQEARRQAFS